MLNSLVDIVLCFRQMATQLWYIDNFYPLHIANIYNLLFLVFDIKQFLTSKGENIAIPGNKREYNDHLFVLSMSMCFDILMSALGTYYNYEGYFEAYIKTCQTRICRYPCSKLHGIYV